MHNWRRPVLNFYDAHITHNPIPRYLAFLNELDRASSERRHEEQADRLRQLLLHASRNVPYYRDVLAKTAVVEGGRVDLTRFREIPKLTRHRLRTEFERLKSDDLGSRPWYKNGSGGSSGEPVTLLQDRYYEEVGLATKEMHYAWAGRKTGEPLVKLWGSDRDVLIGTVGWRNKLSNFVRNQRFQNSFNMGTAHMQRYLNEIRHVRPVVIEAYAESIYELARYINRYSLELPAVRSVITSSGTLYPFIRKEIEQAFGCPTFNRYGSREVGDIAGEREPDAGLEVFPFTHFVEVVDDSGRPCAVDEEGEVLVTCLSNYAMPMIRYAIGDRAVVAATVATPTPSVERLKTVSGRTMDAFVRADGSTVPGYFFVHFLGVVHYAGWLKKTQIIQRDYDSVLIKMVADPPPPGALEEIRGSLRRVIGPTCRVDFEFLDAIPPLPSGKYSYTVSQVSRRKHSA